MKIRFLAMCDSGVPEFPFVPGQVIEVAKPAPWLLSYIDGIRAIRLPDDPPEEPTTEPATRHVTLETAVTVSPERAVAHKGKR